MKNNIPNNAKPCHESYDQKNSILIVEDVGTNIDILLGMLAKEYSVSVALNGQMALEIVKDTNPDLILLDVMMPEMDGYEVCEALKGNSDTRDIPVIFLTALNEDADEEKGLRLGAVDYITKPFNPDIVKARVRSHLALRKAQMDLEKQRDQIENTYRELSILEQHRDDLVHMIVHDMRSQLMIIQFFFEYFNAEHVNEPSFTENFDISKQAANQLVNMASTMLDISRLESEKMPLKCRKTDINTLVEEEVRSMGSLTSHHQLSVDYSKQACISNCDPAIISRVLNNLLGNALKFTPESGKICISLDLEDRWVHFSVSDTGPGIPVECQGQVWEKFSQVENRKERILHSSGLGLTFCKLAIEAHSGSISLESQVGQGTTFHVRLPRFAALTT